MNRTVNRVRDPEFTRLDRAASPWTWGVQGARRAASWKRAEPSGVAMSIANLNGSARWVQTLACRPGEYYRVEAVITCELHSESDHGGLRVVLEPGPAEPAPKPNRRKPRIGPAESPPQPLATPPVRRASKPKTIRAYYQPPRGVRRMTVGVEVRAATGTATIHEVRLIHILEPDEEAHVLAIPPPATALEGPKPARRVCVVTTTGAERPVVEVLREALGSSNVEVASAGTFDARTSRADALLLPDAAPPRFARSLKSLFALADSRIVVISLPAFASLAGEKIRMRSIDQPDDPTHARVELGCAATAGFALHDVFAFAWAGKRRGSFAQRQFRKTAELKEFGKRHQLQTVLGSMCDQDSTSFQPIVLHRAGADGGELYVMDIEPVEAEPSTFGDATLAARLLLNVLGHGQSGLGQFIAHVPHMWRLRELIREMAVRFTPWTVHDEDAPADQITSQLVCVGGDDRSFGLPLRPKPVVVIRSGVMPGDVESVYAAFLWFKQLVRMPPFNCPYAEQLASVVRLAWVPTVHECEASDGWSRADDGPRVAVPFDLGEMDAPVAAVIDLVGVSRNHYRAVIPTDRGPHARLVECLPSCFRSFHAGNHLAWMPGEGDDFANSDSYGWRRVRPEVRVVVDAEAFNDDGSRQVLRQGGAVVRLEIPTWDADFTAQSIHRTSASATLLEQVIGLQVGLIAVNRTGGRVQLDGFAPVEPGDALIRQPEQLARAASAG